MSPLLGPEEHGWHSSEQDSEAATESELDDDDTLGSRTAHLDMLSLDGFTHLTGDVCQDETLCCSPPVHTTYADDNDAAAACPRRPATFDRRKPQALRCDVLACEGEEEPRGSSVTPAGEALQCVMRSSAGLLGCLTPESAMHVGKREMREVPPSLTVIMEGQQSCFAAKEAGTPNLSADEVSALLCFSPPKITYGQALCA